MSYDTFMRVTPSEIGDALEGYYGNTLGALAFKSLDSKGQKPGHWDLSDPKQKAELDEIIRNANKKG